MQQQRLSQNQTAGLEEINSMIITPNTKLTFTYVCSFNFTHTSIHITEKNVEEYKIIQNRTQR